MKSKYSDTLSGVTSTEALSAFDLNFERFATVTVDNRVKIWDVASGSLVKDLFEPAHLSTHYTSLTWGSTNLQAANGEPPQTKRSKKKKGARASSGVIAVGTEKGLVVIWDLQRGEIHLRLGEKGDGHTASVTSVAFSSNGAYLYSCSSDLNVIQWNVESGKIISRFQADKQPVGALALSPDNTVLATASSHIKLWDLSSKKVLKKFTGHAKPVADLAFSADGKYLVSSSTDRFVSLWACSGDLDEISNKNSVVHVFASTGSSKGLEFNRRRPKANKSLELLALSEAGEVCIWKYAVPTAENENKEKGKETGKANGSAQKKSSKPSKADGSIKLPEEATKSKTRAIICASFCAKDEILVAHSNGVNPIFERIKYRDSETGTIRSEVILQVGGEKGALLPVKDAVSDEKKDKERTKEVQEKPKKKVLGPTDMKLPTPKPEPESQKKTGKPQKGAQQQKELTLQEKLEAMEIASKKKEKETAKEDGKQDFVPMVPDESAEAAPKAESLQAVLVQALHTNDRSLMESVLGVSDPAIIANTVSRLPPKYVLPFLDDVIDRFRAKPGRGMVLIIWIKAVLLHHAAYLMSLPNLQDSLSGLYQTVDSRVNSFKGFLKLSGRLDLVLSQIEQHHSHQSVSVQSQPLTVYNEESEDEDEDEDEDDEERSDERGGYHAREDEEEDEDDDDEESENDRMEDEDEEDEDMIMLDRKRNK